MGVPEVWAETTLGCFSVVQSGVGFPKKYQGAMKGDYPVYKVGDVSRAVKDEKGVLFKSEYYVSERESIEMKGKVFPKGSTLFAKIGEAVKLNRRVLLERAGLADNNVMSVKADEDLMDQWTHYLLKTVDLTELCRSTTIPSVRKGDIEDLAVNLPPLAEQKVIADKLDELLAQVEATKARLDAIPATLKAFRQSILAAAVSGKLTEAWRGGDGFNLEFTRLGDAGVQVKTGPFGSALHKSDYITKGIPVINPKHIKDGEILPSDLVTISREKFEELMPWELKEGDVILGRRGEMGRAAVFSDICSQMLCGTGSMILRTSKNASPKYLGIILRSPTAVEYFNSASVGSTMVNLNQKIIKSLEIYFPPIEEQTEIVRRVEELFAYADKVEAQVNAARERVDNLTQATLAKAFRGELTKDWREANPELISGENSAEALLARIQAEREALKPVKKTKKTRKVSKNEN